MNHISSQEATSPVRCAFQILWPPEPADLSTQDLHRNLVRYKQLSAEFPSAQAEKITREVIEALQHIHFTLHRDHRDIEPRNIVVGEHGQAVLIDFGMSRVVPQAQLAHSIRYNEKIADLMCAPFTLRLGWQADHPQIEPLLLQNLRVPARGTWFDTDPLLERIKLGSPPAFLPNPVVDLVQWLRQWRPLKPKEGALTVLFCLHNK